MDISEQEVYITFTTVYEFIRSVNTTDRYTENEATWNLISEYLTRNKSLLLQLSYFTTVSDETELTKKFKLRGATYDVSKEDIDEAKILASELSVNPTECLRVIANCNKRVHLQEGRHSFYAQQILHERNAVLDTIVMLINSESFPQLSEQYLPLFMSEKEAMIKDLIFLFSKISMNLASAELSFNDDNFSRTKFSHDINYLMSILTLLSIRCLNSDIPCSAIEEWFKLLAKMNFMNVVIENDEIPRETALKLHSLTTIVTILMLGLDTANNTINFNAPFFTDESVFKLINKILLQNPTNPIILYYWSFILSLKAYMLEQSPETHVEFVKNVFGATPISELIDIYTSAAEKLHVLKCLRDLHKALSDEEIYSAILSSYLILSLNFIPLNEETSYAIKTILIGTPRELVENFLTSDEFEKKLTVLRDKLPLIHEALIPMIHLTSVHPEFAHFEWKELSTYAQRLKLNDIDYDLAVDEENRIESNELIVLKDGILVKPPMEFEQNVLMPIPKNTKGQIIPAVSGDEDMVIFLYRYNGWSLLGRVLQNICDTYWDNSSLAEKSLKQHLLVSIIDLISSIVDPETPIERSTEILQHCSVHVREEDVISLIFKTCEQSLHSRDMIVLAPCLKLMTSLVANFPHILWSYLSRSDLIDRHGKAGMAAILLGTLELPNGEYDFTISLIQLADQLVTESLHFEATFPDRMKIGLLGRITRHLIHVYESYQYWKYVNITQRIEIGSSLTSLFTKIIYSVHGIDANSKPSEKVTKVLEDAAGAIISVFLGSESPDIRAVTALINVLTSPTSSESIAVNNGIHGNEYNYQLHKTFEFVNMLISVRDLLQLPPSTLEKNIYLRARDFVNIYIFEQSLKVQVIKLFTYLVRAPWDIERPSILAHLGQSHSQQLLELLTFDLETPIQDHRVLKTLYGFFSSVMEGRQDGLSILFLTGEAISFDKNKNSSNSTEHKSILNILRANALKLDQLPEEVGSHLLDAISYAFNSWTPARNNETDKDFITALVKRLEAFQPGSDEEIQTVEQTATMANKYKLISRIAEICALYLFTSTGPCSPIFDLLNRTDLAKIVNPLFQIDGYNKDLHRDIAVNFEEKWKGLQLSKFRLSSLFRVSKSFQNSIYDIPLMDQYFSGDEDWFGSKNSPGFRNQVVEASINLQYVTYQVSAAKSWGALLTSFVKKTPVSLQDTFIDVVIHLLDINIERCIDCQVFGEVYLERIELCFYMLYSFMKTAKEVPENKLMDITLKLIHILKSPEVEFLENIAHSRKSAYYRPLLRSVLITLSLVKSEKHFIESVSNELLGFFEIIFCKSVNLILSEILSEINSTSTCGNNVTVTKITDKIQDLLLLLSLFTSIKKLKPSSNFMQILASSLNEMDTLKSILNLYSSSHLFRINHEPIIADVTLTLLCELCSVDEVAEKLIINGLFSVLLESPISIMIQQGRLKPETQPRIHSIWSNGLLSIILQLISQFGPKMLPECCLFVSYFHKQISTAIFSWSDNSLAISAALIQETSQIIMLQKMFSHLDYQKYLSNPNAKMKVVDDTEVIELIPGLDNDIEKRELYRSFTHLLTHPKYLNSRIVPTTLEEQRLLEDDETRAIFVKRTTEEIKKLQESLFTVF
ncbi:HGR070Wp [Eremothecium sinecaudum]|uniref:Nucleoporin NUP188 n=1 Tax=Eremothecium sinecaudum TaxID=45286 RepID=A0A0X8HVR5_9SACH|nr:HGR070Wp [Eremothecium sinecaudum]AMD22409.1 HGR070Wp [Eremothecium sinecaudum]